MTVALTAHRYDDGNDQWPFLTVSFFQERSLTIRDLSGALLITLNPYISAANRETWESYSSDWDNEELHHWHQAGLDYQQEFNYDRFGVGFDTEHVPQRTTLDSSLNMSTGVANRIFTLDADGNAIIDPSKGPYLPTWQTSPVFMHTLVNRNLYTDPAAASSANQSLATGSVVFGDFEFAPDDLGKGDEPPQTKLYSTLLSIAKERKIRYKASPLTRVFLPIFDSFEAATKKPVALVTALIQWESYFARVLPAQLRGIHLVLDNSCDDVYTFKLTGDEPEPVGLGDLHDTKFDRLARTCSFADVDTVRDGTPSGIPLSHQHGHCVYQITAYPSSEMKSDYQTSLPALVTLAVACCFAFTFILFIFYDRLVERRQSLVLQRAEQTSAIVQSLFPKSVAEKLIRHNEDNDTVTSKKQKLDRFLNGEEETKSIIADLFPECTVFFGDISGPFTQPWSCCVFTSLD